MKHLTAPILLLAVALVGQARGQDLARRAVAAEKTILTAKTTASRRAAVADYVALVRENDLAEAFPPNDVESAILEVLRDHVAGATGIGLETLVGQHNLLLAPGGWYDAVGRGELRANMDAAMVLLHDLTGCSVEASRKRRIVTMFSPTQPADRAQTLGAVVRFGRAWLRNPAPWGMLFHELGHEMFPQAIRPRFDTFNEMWPHIGRQYVYQHLGWDEVFERDRAVFAEALKTNHTDRGLPLEDLGPYDIGAGAIHRIFEATMLRGETWDWAPAKRFFRACLEVKSETDLFHHRQEVMAWLIREHIGQPSLRAAEDLGFSLLPSRVKAIGKELRDVAPVHAVAMAKEGEVRLKALAALVEEFPGTPYAHDACLRLAGSAPDDAAARRWLGAAGFILDWRVVGPFDNRDRKGLGRAFAPERDLDARSYDGAVGEVHWRPVSASPRNGRVDLDAIMRPNDAVVAYLHAVVVAPRACDAILYTGTDDGVAVWVNGENVRRKDVYRGHMTDNEATPCRLKRGRNHILVKVSEGGQAWEAGCRITTAAGLPLSTR